MGPRLTCAAVLAALSLVPVAGLAQGFGDFSAKRVKPPAPGTQQRITVQIAPRANPAVPPLPEKPPAPAASASAAAPVPAQPGASPGRYAWFWEAVSPSKADSGPGRLGPALTKLGDGPGGARVAAPRLQALQDIAETHGRTLLRETVGTRVSPALALAVISVESGGRADAVSRAGAEGLMQLMPATATHFGVEDSFDPAQNIRGGVRFLDHLMEVYDGDPILVLAGYNAGPGTVAENNGVPPYAETRDYVPKVLAAFEVARGLCLSPPELLSDGCVFRISR